MSHSSRHLKQPLIIPFFRYYPRYELQWRLSMLMVGNAVATAFGGLLAFSIAGIKSSNGYSPWRWIFIIEGCITAGVTIAAYPFMSDWPKTAKWLTDSERTILSEKSKSHLLSSYLEPPLTIPSERGLRDRHNHQTHPTKHQAHCFRLEDLRLVSPSHPFLICSINEWH